MKQKLQVGQIVTRINKTGKYVGEITMAKESSYVIRVLAVFAQKSLEILKSLEKDYFK